jgi:hypothetical protein
MPDSDDETEDNGDDENENNALTLLTVNVRDTDDDIEMSSADTENLAIMDAHVRSILAGASPRLFVLNTAALSVMHLRSFPNQRQRPLLTEESITANIEEIYAYYYNDTSDDDEVPISWQDEVN